ncbi:MAG: hypothetical protein D6709_07415 [Chloroflexi bacterium]|jgi:hypothetical protein|uniref:Uncharacterized protein n=1 Tax=Candidatus Thermofonsia Clade 3 bacterium TaxID=2364212 RepID=A0A2M8QE11_9CHLR|nr:hypothetical protein [Candidatus Roseilinea sp. NK_OTU-006]PJF48041.1 MAG: hypothetical protein CUN48_05565 [Candidatus Thermofonsia Clade 3 bacterium]RMG63805.1 MAG: hypothetical protein D6709_07415 [Chloroflexota bacterium]
MKFLDRVRLLIRSTVGGALGAGRLHASSDRRRDRLLGEARLQLETLQEDLAEAEKRGDGALAGRLRDEIAELRRLCDAAEARQRDAQPQSHASPAPQPSPAQSATQAGEAKATSDAQLDETRIADRLRKLREGR